MSKRVKLSLMITIVLGAILFLAATSLPQNATVFYSVYDYLEQQEALGDQFVKVVGQVDVGSIDYNAAALNLRFTLRDKEHKDKAIQVTYNNLKPDTLQNSIEVVAAGKMAADGTFAAKELIVKCPSRYITKEREPAQDGAPSQEGGLRPPSNLSPAGGAPAQGDGR